MDNIDALPKICKKLQWAKIEKKKMFLLTLKTSQIKESKNKTT